MQQDLACCTLESDTINEASCSGVGKAWKLFINKRKVGRLTTDAFDLNGIDDVSNDAAATLVDVKLLSSIRS